MNKTNMIAAGLARLCHLGRLFSLGSTLWVCASLVCVTKVHGQVPEAITGFRWPLAGTLAGSTYCSGYNQFCPNGGSEFLSYYSQVCSQYVYHPGIDWSMPGTNGGCNNGCSVDECNPVYAVAPGIVRYTSSTQWGGVLIEHNYQGQTWYSQYGHVRDVSVSTGDVVCKGQQVAKIGRVGTSCAHLHFEIRKPNHPNPTYGSYWDCQVLANSNNVTNYYENPATFIPNHMAEYSPTLLVPSNNQTFSNGVGIYFDWSSFSGATNYRIQIATSTTGFTQANGFSSTYLEVNATTGTSSNYTNSTTLAPGTYYWSVRGATNCEHSPFSAIRTFTIAGGLRLNSAIGYPTIIRQYCPFSGTTSVRNASSSSWSGKLYLDLYNSSGTYLGTIDSASTSIPANTNYAFGYYKPEILSAPQSAQLHLTYKTTGTTLRPLVDPASFQNPVNVQINPWNCQCYQFGINPTTNWQTHSGSHLKEYSYVYRVNVTNGVTYEFQTGCGNGGTANYDTYLELTGNNCQLAASNDNGCTSPAQTSRIQWTSNFTGYAYLRVKGANTNAFGNFTLAYRSICQPPNAPSATTANPITATSFTANWTAVSGATGYQLDVANNAGFNPLLPGYNALSVSGTSYAVTGLTCGTTYYYRVRSLVNCASGNSNTISVTTSSCPNPCANIGSVVCGSNTTTGLTAGSGLWSLTSCNSGGTPGNEGVYQFTAPSAGNYSISIVNASGGYVDYFWKSGTSCNSSGWNCIGRFNSTTTSANFSLNANQTILLLLDNETTNSASHTWKINCPAPCVPSTDPTSATASLGTICVGGSTVLTVNGGSLGTNANWVWYTGGGCGGVPVSSSTSNQYTVSPSVTTAYYVRGEGPCGITVCQLVVVYVDQPSTAPTGAAASPNSLCAGGQTTLTVQGGSLGGGASWNWHSGSCSGPVVGYGPSISVTNNATTTYYVNAVGSCNTTGCAAVTVTTSGTQSTAATSASAFPNIVCAGGSTTLVVNGGSLGTGANWVWYSGSCGGGKWGSEIASMSRCQQPRPTMCGQWGLAIRPRAFK